MTWETKGRREEGPQPPLIGPHSLAGLATDDRRRICGTAIDGMIMFGLLASSRGEAALGCMLGLVRMEKQGRVGSRGSSRESTRASPDTTEL